MPNRTLCDILDEMRKSCETLNFSYIKGLIEEAQSAGNRMESALYDQSDLDYARREHKKLKQEMNDMKQKIDAYRVEMGKKPKHE